MDIVRIVMIMKEAKKMAKSVVLINASKIKELEKMEHAKIAHLIQGRKMMVNSVEKTSAIRKRGKSFFLMAPVSSVQSFIFLTKMVRSVFSKSVPKGKTYG